MFYTIGIDVSNLTYTCSCVNQTFDVIWFGKTFEQTEEGWTQIPTLLTAHHIPHDALKGIIMENTGCYSENVSYWLYEQQYNVYVEPPHKIHNAFYEEDKDDPIDSRQIAEYGFRFPDRLHPWQPPDEIIEQIHVLLMSYENFSRIGTGAKNRLKSLKKKHRSYIELQGIYEEMIQYTTTMQKKLEKGIADTIASNPNLNQKTQDITSLKYLGLILAAHLLLATNGYQDVKYTSLARYAGVYPIKHTSGTSKKKKRRSRGVGPRRLRKNLYLAAIRLVGYNDTFKAYYQKKLEEGKEKRVILNNVVNKILRIVCGVLRSDTQYNPDYPPKKT